MIITGNQLLDDTLKEEEEEMDERRETIEQAESNWEHETALRPMVSTPPIKAISDRLPSNQYHTTTNTTLNPKYE